MRHDVERASTLRASASEVWRHATSIAGVNAEMGPWLRMTAPPDVRDLSLDDPRVVLGEALFASRVLLLGVVPVDRMRVTLVELERGRRFVEQSPMLGIPYWRHERTVDELAGGCRIRDHLTFEPPIAVAGPVFRGLIDAFFAHRHRRLAQLFGAA
jgi:ligand-binding SRPBCC domain-containing protein